MPVGLQGSAGRIPARAATAGRLGAGAARAGQLARLFWKVVLLTVTGSGGAGDEAARIAQVPRARPRPRSAHACIPFRYSAANSLPCTPLGQVVSETSTFATLIRVEELDIGAPPNASPPLLVSLCPCTIFGAAGA